MLEQLKSLLREQLGLPAWLVLVTGGLAAHLALTVVLRKAPASAWGLLAPLALGLAVEGYEIWVHYRHVGLLAPGNDPLWQILARHALDVARVLCLPLLLVAIGLWSAR